MKNNIFNYNGANVTMRKENGEVYVNLTEVAKAFPEKNLSDIVNSKEIKEYVQKLSERGIYSSLDLLQVVKGNFSDGRGQGTWAHQKVALRVAQKLSTDFAIWVDTKIEELLTTGVATVSDDDEAILHAMTVLQKRVEEGKLKLQQAQKTIQQQAPKVLFADAVATSDRSVLVAELAKVLNQNGVSIGQNRLFIWLREHGYLCSKGEYYNQPTQKAMELGLFEIKKVSITKPDGSVITSSTTKVTGKGQIYFVDKFLGERLTSINPFPHYIQKGVRVKRRGVAER